MNGAPNARQSWPNSYFLINTFYFGLSSDRGFFGYKKRKASLPIQRCNELRGEAKGQATGRGVRLWSQRPG
jgi:hypothetical protein